MFGQEGKGVGYGFCRTPKLLFGSHAFLQCACPAPLVALGRSLKHSPVMAASIRAIAQGVRMMRMSGFFSSQPQGCLSQVRLIGGWVKDVVKIDVWLYSLLGRKVLNALLGGRGILVGDMPIVALARPVRPPDVTAHWGWKHEPMPLAHEHFRRYFHRTSCGVAVVGHAFLQGCEALPREPLNTPGRAMATSC